MSELPPLDRAALEAARARTVARGRRRQRRRRATYAGGVATAVVVLGGVLALADDADRPDVVDIVDGRTTTTVDGRVDPATTTTTAPAPAGSTTTTTTAEPLQPENGDGTGSGDDGAAPAPDCTTVTGGEGPVVADWTSYWQTEPAFNDPLTLVLCISDATPAAGEAVTVTVTADDPDSPVDSPAARGFCRDGACEGRFDNGDGIVYGEPPPPYAVPPAPVPTPPEEPGHAEWYADYAYERPGTYLVSATWYAPYGDDRLPSPYRSVVTATLEVTVG